MPAVCKQPAPAYLSPPAPLAVHCSLHSVHDEAKDKPMEVELGWICEASGWKFATVPKDITAAAEAWAKRQIDAEEMGEDDDE